MTATINGGATILRPQFPRPPSAPVPRLDTDHPPEETTPALIYSRSVSVIAAELRRIRITNGENWVDIALMQALQESSNA